MITLDGTSGITTPGLTNTGTETLVNLTTTGNTILGNASTDTLNVGNGGLIKDSSGNVGVGVTPSAWGAAYRATQVGLGTSVVGGTSLYNFSEFGSNFAAGASELYIGTDFATKYRQFAGEHRWYTAPSGTAGNAITFTQAMTLDASGFLMLNTTGLSGARGYFEISGNSATTRNLISTDNLASGTGASAFVAFMRNGTYTGGISQTGTTSTFVTSSDYRLKENIAPMIGALDKVALLKPVTYTWKLDGSDGQGFIAHELAEIVPDCVVGEKDAVDADGKPVYQGIDTSFLVATLTAAIQEQQALITSLTARLEVLEAK